MEFTIGKEALFEEFLSELQALDDFRGEYARRYEFEGLGRDDQDVQRLVEAMAFYRARTRASVEHSIRQYKLQALEQLFPYLLSPMPAMGLLYPVLASNMTDTRQLPSQANIVVAPPESQAVNVRARAFRSCRDLAVFPLRIVDGSVRLRRRGVGVPAHRAQDASNAGPPWTLTLDIAPSVTGAESKRYFDDPKCSLRELCFYINPSGDVLTAVRLFDALSVSCKRASITIFAEGAARYQSGLVRPRFGSQSDGDRDLSNPIESARRAIHFPLAQLCFTVPVVGAPSEWTRLSLELQLDESWPEGLAVSDQSFVLHAVPVENMMRLSAEPVELDGTLQRSQVQAPEDTAYWRVREVLGVYTSDPNAPGVRETLFPRSLLDDGYMVVAQGSGVEREVWVEADEVLGLVDAPEKLYVEAEWYDPDVNLPNARTAVVRAESHDLGALAWRVLDPLRRPSDSPVLGDAALLDRLLDLQGRPLASARDLKLLLKVVGVDTSDVFGRIPRYVEAVVSCQVPDTQSYGGSVRNYDIRLAKVPSVLAPAVRLLFSIVPGLLATWTGDQDVRVSVSFDAATEALPLVFEWRTTGDG